MKRKYITPIIIALAWMTFLFSNYEDGKIVNISAIPLGFVIGYFAAKISNECLDGENNE